MAATVTSVWAKPGAWALDSEENEAELLQQQQREEAYSKINRANGGGGDTADFPSLAAAASTKTKKKKPQSMSLSEFNKPATFQIPKTRRLTTEDLMMLPTGPRERTAEELERPRGGFRSYDRSESSSSKWGSSRVSDDEPPRSRELAPSRADEVDDWGATKRPVSSNGFERRERGERGGFFGSSESRADDSDNWGSNKKSFAPPSEGRRFENLRSSRVGFESSGGSDSDNWVKKKEEEGRKIGANTTGGGGGGAFDSLRERRVGGFDSNGGDSDTWGKKREEGVGGGRPRLNLQPRTLPLSDGQQNGSVAPAKPKGANPFGEARPREEVLKEKGQDWKEIDEKLESTKMKEVSGADGAAFGKRGFGSGNGRATTPESRVERSWRKTDSADSRPSSADEVEDGLATEAEDAQE